MIHGVAQIVIERVLRPIPPKALYWPASPGYGDDPLTCDSTAFPKLQSIKARANTLSPAQLDVFARTASGALDRVLIVDDYLFNPKVGSQKRRIEQILDWFPETFSAGDVRILTASTGTKDADDSIADKFKEHISLINALKAETGSIQISIKFTLKTHFPYVHDRFAIVDDELWHFGATVGGLHGPLNAASRGWSAVDHLALEFFEAAWQGDSKDAQRPDS